MERKAERLLYTSVVFAVLGIILFIAGPYLPIIAIIPLALASICFLFVIALIILALCNYQRGFAQSKGEDFF